MISPSLNSSDDPEGLASTVPLEHISGFSWNIFPGQFNLERPIRGLHSTGNTAPKSSYPIKQGKGSSRIPIRPERDPRSFCPQPRVICVARYGPRTLLGQTELWMYTSLYGLSRKYDGEQEMRRQKLKDGGILERNNRASYDHRLHV